MLVAITGGPCTYTRDCCRNRKLTECSFTMGEGQMVLASGVYLRMPSDRMLCTADVNRPISRTTALTSVCGQHITLTTQTFRDL